MKRCDICPNNCLIEHSICGRKAIIDENVVESTGVAVDPIEKKPLYHFMPGSETLSVGGIGCNLKCLNCQNHSIAQPVNPSFVPIRTFSPEELVELTLEKDLKSISWTYNEPTIHPEWIISTSKIAKEYDIKTILVTNGYTSKKTLNDMVDYVDAVNVDLKSISDDFYRDVCSGRLNDVKNSIEFYYNNGVHTEVTNLLIPGYDDSTESISALCDYICSVSDSIVLHFSAFYPQFKLNHLPPTSEDTVFKACKTGKATGLKHVYPGNTHSSHDDNTYCGNCNDILVEREYYTVKNYINEGKCPTCGKNVENFVF